MKRLGNNKIIVFLSVFTMLIFLGCGNKNSYTLKGKLNTGEESYLVLSEMEPEGLRPFDTIHVKKNGKFSAKEELLEPSLFILQGPNDYIVFCPQKGEKIQITGNIDNLSSSYHIQGSKESEKLYELSRQAMLTKQRQKQMSDALMMAESEEQADSLKSIFIKANNALHSEQRAFVMDYINKNIGSLTTLTALYRNMGGRPLIDFREDEAVYMKVLKGLEQNYPNNKHTKSLATFIQHLKEAEAVNNGKQSIGNAKWGSNKR